MYKGKAGDWYEDEYVGGFIREDRTLNVCCEFGLSDADIGNHAVEVQNGDGYYDSDGKYRSYGID